MVESRPYIPRDLMGVPIPEDALLDEIRSRHGSPMHLQSESPSQSDILPSELISGSVNAFYAPERSTPTQTASSAGVSGNLNLGDLLQLSGRYSRSDTEEKLPENIKSQFGLQNREHRHREYEGIATIMPSKILDTNEAPPWMTLDKFQVTYGQGRSRFTDERGDVHASGTRTRGAEIGLGIGPIGVDVGYMERGLYDDPNREFSAGASLPLGDGRVSGEFRRNLNPDPRQQDETYVGGRVTIPFQEGGIASLPNSPVLAGQQHMLAYITPEEASTLRAQGGGVTPTGGQYRGPGGIDTFIAPAGAFSGAFSAGVKGGSGGTIGGAGGWGGGRFSVFADTAASKSLVDANTAMADALSQTQVADDKALAVALTTKNAEVSQKAIDKHKVNEKLTAVTQTREGTLAHSEATDAFNAAKAAALAEGYSPAAISKANQVANMNVADFMGNQTLALIDPSGRRHTAYDIATMSDAAFSALSANPATQVEGDPESPLGKAVTGLGTTAVGMMNPALALPTMAIDIASSLSPGRSTGLMSLLGIPGMMNVVGKELGLGETPVGDLTGYIGDAAGYIGEKTGLSDIDFGAATKSLGFSGEPSPYAERPSNLGPGISLPPPAGIPSVEIGLQVPPTTATETLLDATSSYYDAEDLARITGVTVPQARAYLDSLSRYAGQPIAGTIPTGFDESLGQPGQVGPQMIWNPEWGENPYAPPPQFLSKPMPPGWQGPIPNLMSQKLLDKFGHQLTQAERDKSTAWLQQYPNWIAENWERNPAYEEWMQQPHIRPMAQPA